MSDDDDGDGALTHTGSHCQHCKSVYMVGVNGTTLVTLRASDIPFFFSE